MRGTSLTERKTTLRGIRLDCSQLNDGAAMAPFAYDTVGIFAPDIETEELAVSTGVASVTAQGGAHRCGGQMSDVDGHPD
jgi:hypothetical protein